MLGPISYVLDLIYVPACAACDARVPGGAPMCQPCAVSLDLIESACPTCAAPQSGPEGNPCRVCLTRPPPLSRVTSVYSYGGQLARAIQRLKFRQRPDVARTLAPLFAPVLTAALIDIDIVIPIPLYWRRHAHRGYNQTQLLLAHGHRDTGTATADVLSLRRTRQTRPQHGLDASARRANLEGAFQVPPRRTRHIRGARILLLDDVMTTGSTLNAAALALRASGAADVQGFTLARAEA